MSGGGSDRRLEKNSPNVITIRKYKTTRLADYIAGRKMGECVRDWCKRLNGREQLGRTGRRREDNVD